MKTKQIKKGLGNGEAERAINYNKKNQSDDYSLVVNYHHVVWVLIFIYESSDYF